jgi:hypothetical protein
MGGALSGIFGSGQGASWTAQSAPITTQNGLTDQINQNVAQGQQLTSQQQQFLQQLQGQNGIQNQSNVLAQQGQLAAQLQQQANGQGPNVAQNQLNQATGQNTANQAALMAGQRGASANVGLMAKQIAQQGAANQQQAAGQAATLGSQQQIAAQQALAGQQQAMGQTAASQIANTQNQQQSLAQNNLAQQGISQGALANQNNAGVSNVAQQNTANSTIQKGNQQAQMGAFGEATGSLGSALSAFADGGVVGTPPPGASAPLATMNKPPTGTSTGPQSYIGKVMAGQAPPDNPFSAGFQKGAANMQGLIKGVKDIMAKVNAPPAAGAPGADANTAGTTAPTESTAPASSAAAEPASASDFASPGAADAVTPATDATADAGSAAADAGDAAADAGDAAGAVDSAAAALSQGGTVEDKGNVACGNTARKYDDGGSVAPSLSPTASSGTDAPSGMTSNALFADIAKVIPVIAAALNKGGTVPALVSPGEEYLEPDEARAVAQGKAHPLKAGKIVPGKAEVKGNSLKNDKVHANLKVGGVVIPRSVMTSKNPAENAAKFVRAVMAKQGLRR